MVDRTPSFTSNRKPRKSSIFDETPDKDNQPSKFVKFFKTEPLVEQVTLMECDSSSSSDLSEQQIKKFVKVVADEDSGSEFSERPLTIKKLKLKKVIRKPPAPLVRKIRRSPRKLTPMLEEESEFNCKTCHEQFETGQALGGHMSRVHPGQS